MKYITEIRADILHGIAKEVADRIIFQNYYIIPKDERIPLKDIIRNIGTEEDIQTITDHFKKWTEPNPRLFVYIACNLAQRLIDSDKSQQKTLDFVIRDVSDGNIVLCGRILFQNSEVSFHT